MKNRTGDSSKDTIWRHTRLKVNRLTDSRGKRVDTKIQETITALLAYSFPTTASCEGHTRWGYPYPWVAIDVASPFVHHWKDKKNISKWKQLNLAHQKKILALLERFYQARRTPHAFRLIIVPQGIAGAFRLQSVSGPATVGLPRRQLRTKLIRQQKEMQAFARFLHLRWFKGTPSNLTVRG